MTDSGPRLEYLSHGEDETEAVAAALGRLLEPGSLVALDGDLGSGKTCFVRGLAQGLGISPGRVRSPSFTLINEYSGGRLPLYHIDLYRVAPEDVDTLALREYLDGDGVCAVEWFERLGEESPHLALHFTFVAECSRRLVAIARGGRYDELLLTLAAQIHRREDGIGRN